MNKEQILNILGIDISEKVINWDLIVELNKTFKKKKISSYINFDNGLDKAVISVQTTINKYIKVEKEKKEKKEKELLEKNKELEKKLLEEQARLKIEQKRIEDYEKDILSKLKTKYE